MHPIHLTDLHQISKLIQKSKTQDIVVYEFHRPITEEKYSETSFEEFQRRSEPYYKTYIGYSTDDLPANIDHVVKLNGEWYVMLDTSSNYYLGNGPSSLLMLREICFNRSIGILNVECHVIEFLFDKFSDYQLPRHLFYREFREKLDELKSLKKSEPSKRADHKQSKSSPKATATEQDLRILQRQSFNIINGIISKAKSVLLEDKDVLQGKTEEQLRDALLPLIKVNKDAFAEPKTRRGYCDILFPSTATRCNYIYECKVGVTRKQLQSGIEQLLQKYLSPQDRFGGIIIFNKEVNFSKQLKSFPTFISETGGKVESINIKTSLGEEFECTYPRDGDENDQITVYIFLINVR